MRAARGLTLSLLLLSSVAGSQAQKLNVSTIAFSGDSIPSADLQAACGLKPGPLDASQVQAGAQKLNDSGMFAHIDFAVHGNVLQFQLKPSPGRVPAHFENFAWETDNALIERVHGVVPLFDGHVVPDSGLDQQVVMALTSQAAEQHLSATVESHPEMAAGAVSAVRYRIASPAVTVGTVTLSGESPAMSAELDPIAKAAAGQPYDSYGSADVLGQAIRSVYGNHGFLDATIAGTDHGPPSISGDGMVVPLAVRVAEGAQYRVKELRFAHPLLLNEAEFQAKANLHAGDVANQELLRRSLLLIGVPYRKQGYIHAKIAGNPSLDRTASTVTYTIQVEPGDAYKFGKLEVANLTDGQRAEFLKVWKLQPGDIYDATYAQQFLNANAKSLRSLDGYSATYNQIDHLDTHVADLQIIFRKDQSLH